MPKKIDDKLIEILSKYDEDPKKALWDCHGTWVAYHKAIERIAAKAGIEYKEPTVLVADKDAAAILVTGKLGDKTEWSIGEAAINLNYRVSGKQAAYPFAMAEKRGKDRVVLKLIGLHGLVYSEEESDDFKSNGNGNADWAREPTEAPAKSSAQLKRENFWPEFEQELEECETLVALEKFKEAWRDKARKDGWNQAFKEAARDRIEGRHNAILQAMDAAELAGIPVKEALQRSVTQNSNQTILSGG